MLPKILDIVDQIAADDRLPLITQQREELAAMVREMTEYLRHDRSHRATDLRHAADDLLGRHQRQGRIDDAGEHPIP